MRFGWLLSQKRSPLRQLRQLSRQAATHLGENYVEEALPKIHELRNEKLINWHMIGHVQSRKASLVCEYFQYLHSLDSVKLAEKLSRHALEMNKTLPVMLEFNVSGEQSKSGWNLGINENWESILVDIEKIIPLQNITLLGVMAIPPFSENPEEFRPYYQRIRKFQEAVNNTFSLPLFSEISIGMSGDFEIAIQEGSTCVRIGQAIFGPRIK